MQGKDRYRRTKSSQMSRKESKILTFSGTLGITTNGENQVEVPGRPGYVWVQLRNQLNETIQAFNESVSPVFSLPVLVEYDKDNPIRYKVRGRDIGRYTVWVTTTSGGDTVPSTSSYLPAHGASHSFNKLTGAGGGDVVWVYSDQFMPWAVTPSGSAGALSVSIQPSAYYYDQQFRWAGGTGIAGLDVLRPTGSSNARMILVYLDPDTGNPYLATGTLTEFANTITGTQQIMPYMPSLIEETDIPLAGIRLITGTSKILWQNLYDLRDYFAHSSTSGSSGGGGAPTDAEYVVMSLDGTLTDERVLTAGADVTLSDGGAGGNATVGVATGTFSRAGHSHLFPYSVAIYDDHVFKATGTILDFTGNIDVAVTGSSVFISSTAAGGGGSTVLIYDDGSFKVTGTAIDFSDDLKVDVTGSIAYVNIPTGTFSRPGHVHTNELPIFDSSAFKATGTLISFDDNLTVHVTGTTVFIEGQAGASGDNTILIYDGSAFKVTGSAISFDDNLTVHVTGSTAYVVGQAGGAGGFPIIYDDSVFKNTGVSISFDEDIEVASTGTTSYVGVPTGTFSRPGHTHYQGEVTDLQHAIPIYEDSVFKATGTIIDFGTNVNVAVTGSVIFVSTVDTTGGGGGDLLIYDNDVFKVTGTALDFGDYLNVAVTGSIAYISSPFSPTGFDIGARVYNSTGTIISNNSWKDLTFDSERYDTDGIHSGSSSQLYCNTAGKYLLVGNVAWETNTTNERRIGLYLNNETYIGLNSNEGSTNIATTQIITTIYDLNVGDYVTLRVYQNSGGDLDILFGSNYSPEFMMHKIDGGGNAIQVYDDSVFVATGTTISFDNGLDVVSTGTTAYVSSVDMFGYAADGRLTVQSGNPIPTGSFSEVSTLYYSPYGGDRIALYDGNTWSITNFSETALSLSGISSGTAYDIFGFVTGTSLGLETVAWTDRTSRATDLTRQNGVLVKSGDATRRYLGTIYTDVNGQTKDTLDQRFVWNYYNKVERKLYKSTTTSNTYTYSTATWRSAEAKNDMRLQFIIGVDEQLVRAEVVVNVSLGTNDKYEIGFGLDKTNGSDTQYGNKGQSAFVQTGAAGPAGLYYHSWARYWSNPGIGFHYLQLVEIANIGTINFEPYQQNNLHGSMFA